MDYTSILSSISADLGYISEMVSKLDVSLEVGISVLSWITVILGLHLGFEVVKFILEVIHDGFN